MRSLLMLTCGDPVRVATTAAVLAIASVAVGRGWDLLRAIALTSIAASSFMLLYGILDLIAVASGVLDEDPKSKTGEAEDA